jgi:hypothetical protein
VWSGYKVHLTETCDDGVPNLITNVETTNAAVSARRAISVRPEAQHEALRLGRAREQTASFMAKYARRAGVEGTIAQGVRSSRLRRKPYFGQAKTHLAHLMTAAAMNLVRVLRWLAGEPKAQTQHSAFAQLHPLAA